MEFQAVILAAGTGTRFRDLVSNRPKCLLQVGPYPLIFYPLNFASNIGFEGKKIISSSKFLNQKINFYFRNPHYCVGISKE